MHLQTARGGFRQRSVDFVCEQSRDSRPVGHRPTRLVPVPSGAFEGQPTNPYRPGLHLSGGLGLEWGQNGVRQAKYPLVRGGKVPYDAPDCEYGMALLLKPHKSYRQPVRPRCGKRSD